LHTIRTTDQIREQLRKYTRIVPLEEAAARDYAALTPGLEKRAGSDDEWDLSIMTMPMPASPMRHTRALQLNAVDSKDKKQASPSSTLPGSRAEDPFEISSEDDENPVVQTARTHLFLKRKMPSTQLPPTNKRAKATISKGKDAVTAFDEGSDSDLQSKSSASEEDADEDADQDHDSEELAGEGSENSATDFDNSADHFLISNRRLFSTEASAQDVLDNVLAVLPELHLSSPLVRDFLQRIKDRKYPQLITPHWDADTQRFTGYDPELETFWAGVVKNEPMLKAGTYHTGLDMDKRLIKAHWQAFDSAMVVMGSYPTKDTTVY